MKPRIGSLIAVIACTVSVSAAPPFEESFQIPKWSVASYQSPELRNENQDTNLSVVVAISGGGLRAANFGIAVLLNLESVTSADTQRNVLSEVDGLSTVSGGGVAAAVYVSSRYDHATSDSTNRYSLTSELIADGKRLLTNLRRN